MNTNVFAMIGALVAFMPLIVISITLQASAIEEAATFSQSISGSGIEAKASAINILTQNGELDTQYTQQEFQDRFENCGNNLPGVTSTNHLEVKSSENGCSLNDPRNGTLRIGVQVSEGGDLRNEKILIGY